MGIFRAATATCAVFNLLLPIPLLAVDLEKVHKITVSSASTDFATDNSAGYIAASKWCGERLRRDVVRNSRAPYMVCAEYSEGREALTSLETNFGMSAIHRVSNSEAAGSCFIVTASPSAATDMLSTPGTLSLLSAGPFLPSLKLASGLLDHGLELSDLPGRLRSTYGADVLLDGVHGLTVRLSPGILPLTRGEPRAREFVRSWHDEIMKTASVKSLSFWSDPDFDRSALDKTRVREWSRAAAVVDDLASKDGRPVGEVCKLGNLRRMHHVGDDLLKVEGIDHLLPGDEPPSETKMACYMALLMQLAVKPEVLRVSPTHRAKPLGSVASAVVQSATTTETPLLDAGLDGQGEVIQMVDSGLDEMSCFFADDDGLEVEHGHLFDGYHMESDGSMSPALGNYSFVYDMSRRKVVQYIEQFKTPDENGGGANGDDNTEDSFAYASDYLATGYSEYHTYDYDSEYSSPEIWSEDSYCPYLLDYYFSYVYEDPSYSPSASPASSPASPYSSSSPASPSPPFDGGFHRDTVSGHGTCTAGLAAGAISEGAVIAQDECCGDELPGCAGGCVAASTIDENLDNGMFDLDAFCPAYECDGEGFSYSYCLGDDPVETLHQHEGVAPGAKISVFDSSYTADDMYVHLAGNLVWESAMGTGAKIHSNSWGSGSSCRVTEDDLLYDSFMYENPEHLLVFGAGNDGGLKDFPTLEACTVMSGPLGKNSLAVGATSSGPFGGTETGTDGRLMYDRYGLTNYSAEGYPYICLNPGLGEPSSSADQADIDAVAWLSSYGPTMDGRIKPEVVAPGDMVFCASGDGTGGNSCKLLAAGGTSGSCPLVAGSAALVRQYFKDSSFYASHVSSRGACAAGSDFQCSSFSPSSATVKALIINSAHLMGGSSEPDGFRGFGRVHLEAGLPLDDAGALGLLVVDSATATIDSYGENTEVVDIDGDAGLDLRITLSWIDPPTTALSAVQLVNDLDLVVTAPSGITYTMWLSGAPDTSNVNERVVVPAASVESGEWTVTVSAKQLLAKQGYSLVVTGAISSSEYASAQGAEAAATSVGSNSFFGRMLYPVLSLVVTLMVHYH